MFAFVNDFERPVGTYLYGRRLYEEMVGYLETADTRPGQTSLMLDFARIWQGADKVVYSRTLDRACTARTSIERHFDPEAIRRMKAQGQDITIGGPGLAAHAIKAGLVDEYHLVISPIVLGGGKAALPAGVRRPLELADERRFGSGATSTTDEAVSR